MSNRIMFSAVSSGSGKTLITCGILQALVNRGLNVASFKCGPDYIDPMFHSKVIGAKSRNLDSFFTKENEIKYLLEKNSVDMDISVMEGVMGFYDGLAGISKKASSYDVAKITKTPVILIINCKGMSLSILPIIKGFMEYAKDSNIKGVILNKMSKMIYDDIKNLIEKELKIKVLGYVEDVKDLTIESRHLGLVKPEEVLNLKEKLNNLANILEETLEIDEIINLAKASEKLEYTKPEIKKINHKVKIAVARDEAFCFYYEDNLELLKEMGAEIKYISPLRDKELPKEIDGIILGGGYPELYAKELSKNICFLEDINKRINEGLPCLAECGGFMYLNNSLEDKEGNIFPMAKVLDGDSYKTSKLGRFGYIDIECLKDNFLCKKGEIIKAHEFHYWDSTICGEDFNAKKPLRKRSWKCINTTENLFAGFPHLYFYSNLEVPYRFLNKCIEYGGKNEFR